jgi:hypothetical protein
MEVQLHSFLTSGLKGVVKFKPWELVPGQRTHTVRETGHRVGPGTDVQVLENRQMSRWVTYQSYKLIGNCGKTDVTGTRRLTGAGRSATHHCSRCNPTPQRSWFSDGLQHVLCRTGKCNDVTQTSVRPSYIHTSCISTCIIHGWYSKEGRWGKGPRDPKRHKLSRATPLNFTKYKARNFAPPQTHEEATCGWTWHVHPEDWCRHKNTHKHKHTYSLQHVTAYSAVVRFLPISLWVNKAKKFKCSHCACASSSVPLHGPENFIYYFASRSREWARGMMALGALSELPAVYLTSLIRKPTLVHVL